MKLYYRLGTVNSKMVMQCLPNLNFYRPQTKFVKVMFLHLSVILFTGVSASVHAGIPPPLPLWDQAPPIPGNPWTRPPRADTSPGADTPREQTPLGAETPRSRHPLGADTPPLPWSRPEEQTPLGTDPPKQRRLLLCTVRILLECILIGHIFATFL